MEIRKLDGFSHFLKIVPFTQLQGAARDGPIILINLSNVRSDALIIQHTGDPFHVPLPDLTPQLVDRLSEQITEAASGKKVGDQDIKDILIDVLRTIWATVTEPIVTALENELHIPPKSRIWFCPTSRLWSLPLHASGPFKPKVRNLPDRFICSYTPTITSLLQAHNRHAPCTSPRLLVAAQPEAEGETELPGVDIEVARIKRVVERRTVIGGERCSREAVRSEVQRTNWAHFACHGHQIQQDPLASRFSLKDHLTLRQIMQLDLPQAELAVLSACHTAAGDRRTPDEALHLASGMLFAGFRSVVGTMWACADRDGPILTEAFYTHMCRNGQDSMNFRDSAEALSIAVRELRRQKVPLERWINFVHYGL